MQNNVTKYLAVPIAAFTLEQKLISCCEKDNRLLMEDISQLEQQIVSLKDCIEKILSERVKMFPYY